MHAEPSEWTRRARSPLGVLGQQFVGEVEVSPACPAIPSYWVPAPVTKRSFAVGQPGEGRKHQEHVGGRAVTRPNDDRHVVLDMACAQPGA